jgi:hypothetical protein
MKQRPRIRLRFVGDRPRILVAEPYYTPVSIVQTAAGALGAFATIIGGMAAVVGNGVLVPLLGMAVVCLLIFAVGELTLVRADSVSRQLSESDSDTSELLCRIGRHNYQPQGVTTEDRLGLTLRPQPPRMVWICARCGDEQRLTSGVSPE